MPLKDGVPVILGMYDGRVDFKKTPAGVSLPLSITEGPIVGCIQSDHPEKMTIRIRNLDGQQIELEEIVYPDLATTTHHEIIIGNIFEHSHTYRYRAIAIVRAGFRSSRRG